MRRALAAAVPGAAALAAACLSIPPYRPTPLVTYSDDAGGATVTGPDFALHFAGGTRFHFPDSLTIDGVELIGHDAAPRCLDESGTGFLLFPTRRISDDGEAPPTESTLEPVLSGPAVVQVRVGWATQFDCNRTRAPHGASTFTVFPDRRIVRHDVLGDANQVQITASACQCTQPLPEEEGKFFVNSFWSLSRASFAKAWALGPTRDPTTPDPLTLPGPGSNTSGYDTVCLDGSNSAYQLVSAWVNPTEDSAVLFGRDALISHDVQKPIDTTKLDVAWDLHGELVLEHAGCTAAFRRALDYEAPPVLVINGTATTASPLDGIYGGDSGDGKPGIAVQGGRATLTGHLALPFAVWLRFPDAIDLPHATRAGATGPWYVPQRLDDRTWIVWFRDPLSDGETIIIEPL